MKQAAAALLMLAAAAFPVPREPNQVFYVQRSVNANTIVYVARLDANGQLAAERPVDVYWRRFNDEGEKKELSALERNFAFGVKAEKAAGEPGSFMMRVISYPKRPALLRIAGGVPQLEAKVAGEPCRLDHAYLEVDESGSLPSVSRVDLYGYSLATGAPVKESFIP